MEELPVHRFPGAPPAVVALHGFTQHGGVFAELAALLGREVLAPDLPGHGRAARMPASFQDAVAAVAGMADERPLIGYSQGGRIALGVALEHPETISHLILISAGVGIANEQKRRARQISDEALAQSIERDGLEAFLESWMHRPIFDGLQQRGDDWASRDLGHRLENTSNGIAAALRGMGQGVQPSYGGRLDELAVPVLFIAGGKDTPYVAIGEHVAERAPYGRMVVIEDAGHPVIGEAPADVAREIELFLGDC